MDFVEQKINLILHNYGDNHDPRNFTYIELSNKLYNWHI